MTFKQKNQLIEDVSAFPKALEKLTVVQFGANIYQIEINGKFFTDYNKCHSFVIDPIIKKFDDELDHDAFLKQIGNKNAKRNTNK